VGINVLQLPLKDINQNHCGGIQGELRSVRRSVTAISDLPHQCSERSARSGVEPSAMWAINVSKMGLCGSKNAEKTGALADDLIK